MRPAVFLDRDGTLIEEMGYLDRLDRLALFPYTIDAVRLLNRAGFAVVVVTNQAGIARGIVEESFVHESHRVISARLAEGGARIEAYYYCPHHPDGSVPEESVRSMRAIGRWLQVNGESIYATRASLFAQLPWGRSTTRGRTIYLHVFDWPADGTLAVPGLATRATGARLLAGGAAVAATTTDAGLVLKLPARAPDSIASVIAVALEEQPRVR